MSTGSTVCGLEAGEVFLLLLLVSGGASTAPTEEGSGFGDTGGCCHCPSYPPLGSDVGAAP